MLNIIRAGMYTSVQDGDVIVFVNPESVTVGR